MSKITHSGEDKLSSWYLEIDRGLLFLVLLMIGVGFFTLVTAGAAEAARMSYPWYYFIKKAFVPYLIGLFCLFGFSMLNKKQIINISVVILVVGLVSLLLTVIPNPFQMLKNGSHRWVKIFGQTFMPADVLKPAFIVLTAWFLNKMRNVYGTDIFFNKEAWRAKWLSWWPYIVIFCLCLLIFYKHPDIGNMILYFCVLGIMLFVAGLPWKLLPWFGGALGLLGAVAILTKAHVHDRFLHMFDVAPYTQAWYSINSIKNGGLFGKGPDSTVKDILPESTNDFVYASTAEDWGAVGCIALLLLLWLVLNNLIKHGIHARDNFVIYAIAGVVALFGGQICFNLMTALHLFISKGMTLPFISYGGVAFVTFCVIFGMILALIHDDTWNK